MTSDVVIVGGGLLGMLTALELVDAGAEVEIIDRGALGGEASSAAAGILGAQCEAVGPGKLFDFGVRAREAWPALASYLFESTGVDIGFRRRGLSARGKPEWLQRQYGWQLQAGLGRSTAPDQLVFDLEAQVEPIKVVEALAERLKQTRVKVTRAEVTELSVEAHPKLDSSDGPRQPGAVVVTLGAWTNQLRIAGGTGALPEVEPQFGVLAEFRDSGPVQPVQFSADAYVIWRDDHRVTAGFTAEDRGFDKRIAPADVDEVVRRAASLCPQLADAQLLRAWAGLRPKPVKGVPFVGRVRDDLPVFAAAGQHRNGILHAPLVGEILALMVQNPGRSTNPT